MSEQMPEVGDVFKSKKGLQIFHVIKVSKNAVRCFRKGFILKPETFNKEDFLERCKYLGKSKANINQLFEVDDERSK